MDLANTAVRWINLDSQPTKSSEIAPALGGGKTAHRVFSDDLAAIYQGQKPADSGNNLPSEEPQLDTVEVRLLMTDSHRVTLDAGKSAASQDAADTLKPQSSSSRINQTDLINEISAFNEESQTHSASESDESLTALVGSIKPRLNQYEASAEGSEKTGHSVIRATVSLSSDLSGTPAEFSSALQRPIGTNTKGAGTATDTLTATQANSSMQGISGASPFSSSPKLDTASQTLQAADVNPTSAVKLEPTKPGLMTNTITVNLAPTAETTNTLRVTHPLNTEGLLVATQMSGKHASEIGKPIKGAIAASSEQKFKLPDESGKQVPVKLVMIEASTTLQQWQKLKQIDSDTAESSPEAPSTLLQSESRVLRASPELQAARLVKTEQDAQALSQKFAEQLGQRLIQNVQKGHWRAELELHPRSLGRIDVQLDFVNGQLEGHFQTHNPATRELLQEGLPRLREWLQQTGTQVASLEVNNGNSGQGGEKPTPQMLSGRQNDSVTDEAVAELANQEAKPQALKEGFDLLV